MKRIVLLLGVVTLSVFGYEYSYSGKAISSVGEIKSITLKGRGREMMIMFAYEDKRKGIFTSDMLVVDDLLRKYKIGDEIPVIYCEDCYPIAKVGSIFYVYLWTFMMLLLDLIMIIVLVITWWKSEATSRNGTQRW